MAKRFTERQKLSKKARRALDNQARATWGSLKPTAKKIDSAKRYNRKRFRSADPGEYGSVFYCCNSKPMPTAVRRTA